MFAEQKSSQMLVNNEISPAEVHLIGFISLVIT